MTAKRKGKLSEGIQKNSTLIPDPVNIASTGEIHEALNLGTRIKKAAAHVGLADPYYNTQSVENLKKIDILINRLTSRYAGLIQNALANGYKGYEMTATDKPKRPLADPRAARGVEKVPKTVPPPDFFTNYGPPPTDPRYQAMASSGATPTTRPLKDPRATTRTPTTPAATPSVSPYTRAAAARAAIMRARAALQQRQNND